MEFLNNIPPWVGEAIAGLLLAIVGWLWKDKRTVTQALDTVVKGVEVGAHKTTKTAVEGLATKTVSKVIDAAIRRLNADKK